LSHIQDIVVCNHHPVPKIQIKETAGRFFNYATRGSAILEFVHGPATLYLLYF